MGNPEYLCGDKYLNNLCSLLELYNYKQCSLFLCLTSRCDPPATFMLQTFVTASSELSLAKSRNLCASRPVSSFVVWNEANDRSLFFFGNFWYCIAMSAVSPHLQTVHFHLEIFHHSSNSRPFLQPIRLELKRE